VLTDKYPLVHFKIICAHTQQKVKQLAERKETMQVFAAQLMLDMQRKLAHGDRLSQNYWPLNVPFSAAHAYYERAQRKENFGHMHCRSGTKHLKKPFHKNWKKLCVMVNQQKQK
jgi:hypothetical protein